MTLAVGAPAPDFALPSDAGEAVSLSDLTRAGPTLLAFFKTTCPTCRLAFPVFGDIARRYGDAAPVVAVSQDPLDTARPWLDALGFPGPVLDDATGDFAVSSAYGLQAVPTAVLVDRSASVRAVSVGWDRAAVNDLARWLGDATGRDTSPVSTENDGRPPAKPG